MPARRPLSSTIRWRTRACCILERHASYVSLTSATTSSVDMTSRTLVVAGLRPAATMRVSTSRSEKIPARRSPSTTGTAPMFRSAITRAASAVELDGPTTTVALSPMIALIDFMAATSISDSTPAPAAMPASARAPVPAPCDEKPLCYTRPMTVRGMFRPGMRGYIIPLVAGVALAISAFLPWVIVGEIVLRGFPDTMALWIIGLGAAAALLATLSLITRKNSRHPLLLVGLVALGLMFLSWRIMPRTIADRALIRSQALAIVGGTAMSSAPSTLVGIGIYVRLAAGVVLGWFGLTIVVKRASQPYVAPPDLDDDV